MKAYKNLLVVIVNLLLQPLFAQFTYLPIGKTWEVCVEYADVPDMADVPAYRGQHSLQNNSPYYDIQTYTILGDTVIDGVKFVKVNSYSQETKYFYLRQREKKVYGRLDDWEEDILLADYDLKVGDEIQYGVWEGKSVFKVSSVEIITLKNGGQAKRICYEGYPELEDIEYIGDNQMGYINHLNRATFNSIEFDNKYSLMSCSDNAMVLYSNAECICNLSNALENISTTPLVFSPNPVQDILQITSAESIETVAIYTLGGERVLQATTTQVDVSNLKEGMYIVHTTSQAGTHYLTKVVKK